MCADFGDSYRGGADSVRRRGSLCDLRISAELQHQNNSFHQLSYLIIFILHNFLQLSLISRQLICDGSLLLQEVMELSRNSVIDVTPTIEISESMFT